MSNTWKLARGRGVSGDSAPEPRRRPQMAWLRSDFAAITQAEVRPAGRPAPWQEALRNTAHPWDSMRTPGVTVGRGVPGCPILCPCAVSPGQYWGTLLFMEGRSLGENRL